MEAKRRSTEVLMLLRKIQESNRSHALTIPTSTSCWNLRAAAPERVKMAVPLPYSFAFTNWMASSRLSTCVL